MSAIRKPDPAMVPGLPVSNDGKIVRLCPRSSRTVLASRWQRGADGRLSCVWRGVAWLPYAPLHGAVTEVDEHRS